MRRQLGSLVVAVFFLSFLVVLPLLLNTLPFCPPTRRRKT